MWRHMTRLSHVAVRVAVGCSGGSSPGGGARLGAKIVELEITQDNGSIAVDRLDDVEQRHRIRHLVGLQRSDEMQLDIAMGRLERRPFRACLLHPVFPERPLAGGDHRHDRFRPERLAHRHQGDRR